MGHLNKTILITGAHRGLGLLCAQKLKKTHKVIQACRRLDPGRTAEYQASGADFIQLDVTNLNEINKVKEYVEQTYGTLDVLINNAGEFIRALIYNARFYAAIEKVKFRRCHEYYKQYV